MSDLLLEVLKDDALSIGAKGLFAYLYTVNNECEKTLEEILEEVNIHQKTFATYIQDLICCGYVKARYIWTFDKKPMFAFKDSNFEFKINNEGIYYRPSRRRYEVYIKTNTNSRKYLGSTDTISKAQNMKRKYKLEHEEEFIFEK